MSMDGPVYVFIRYALMWQVGWVHDGAERRKDTMYPLKSRDELVALFSPAFRRGQLEVNHSGDGVGPKHDRRR